MSQSGFFQSAPPDVAVEIGATHVAAARLAWASSGAAVAGHVTESLRPGLVTPALAAPNLSDVTAVSHAIGRALERLGGRPRRVALVLPDTVAKVSLIRFDTVPARLADLTELVRWQVRKSAPFPVEQAVVSFTPGSQPAEGGQEFIVSIARTDIVQEYEAACTQAGVHAGLVDLASFSIINGVLAGPDAPRGDWLLVHATTTYTTIAVSRGADVILFRSRAEEAEGSLADEVHQTAMYYEDRLKGAGFTRALLAGGSRVPGGAEAVRRSLEERLSVAVDGIDPRASAALSDRIDASADLLAGLAPLVGILLRERQAA